MTGITTEQLQPGAFEVLRQFARRPGRRVEHCELCSVALASEHAHVVEIACRRLLCACDACAMLFTERGGAKYKRVPRQSRFLPDFRLTDAQWDSLMIPINLAFFFRMSADARVSALYPSPAGATESLLSLEAWDQIIENNLSLRSMEADVEALLVNRVAHGRGEASAEYYIVPIDLCYQLVGMIRLNWRGLSGGSEVWSEIGKFFAKLRVDSQIVYEDVHA
jgi:hypothetical protein